MTAKELYRLVVKNKTLVPDSAESTYEAAVNLAFGIGAISGAGVLLVAKKVHDARIKRK